MSYDGKSTPPELPTVDELQQEFHRLSEQQRFTLDRATYLGMSRDEAKGFDERRKHIAMLVEQLARLKKSG
jgi:hypothetical protein